MGRSGGRPRPINAEAIAKDRPWQVARPCLPYLQPTRACVAFGATRHLIPNRWHAGSTSHPVALTLLNQVLGKLAIGGRKGSQSQGFACIELNVESSKGHAAPEPERGLGKTVREAKRLQAGSRVGQNLRSEIKVGIGSEDRAIDLPLLQLAEQAARLLKLLRGLWVLLLNQEQGADLPGDFHQRDVPQGKVACSHGQLTRRKEPPASLHRSGASRPQAKAGVTQRIGTG